MVKLTTQPNCLKAYQVMKKYDATDGDISDEELNYLATKLYAIGDAEDLINLSAKYSKKQSLEEFQKEANQILTKEQKLTVLANLIDILLADGSAEEEEQESIFLFCKCFWYFRR